MTLLDFLQLSITCASLTIMVYDCTYQVGENYYDDYKFHVTLKNTHKRLNNYVNRLVDEYGNYTVQAIEWREKGDILLKVK